MVIDLHNDLLTARKSAEWDEELSDYAENSAKTILAVWTTELRPDLTGITRFFEYGSRSAGTAIEDLGSVDTDDFEALFDLCPLVYASLTWNGENRLAGGCGFEKPLTDLGRKVAGYMEKRRVALDLSHLSDVAFYDALDACGRILVTHTASRKLSDHPRCITDDMALKVAERGGIVGVAAVPNFLRADLKYGDNTDRKTYALHLAHFAALIGSDHVAIGSDFNGAQYYPEGLESYADFPELRRDMKNLGFDDKEIDKIFYGNAERFFGLSKENK